MMLEELNTKYNAFITIKEIKGKSKGKLSGLTFGIKDIIITKGVKTTAGSRILKDYVPDNDAWIVKRILDQGGTIRGKTNTHEFAIGATNTSSIGGPAKNPVDPERITGGSSGGSAAAVALNMVDIGIGTDTGGSIRIPASLCGVVGFKPTTGVIPTDGIIPFSWTLDTVGFIARDVETIWNVLEAVVPPEMGHILTTEARRRPRAGIFLFGEDESSHALKPVLNKLSSIFDLVEVNMNFLQGFGSNIRGTIALAEGASYHREWIESSPGMYFPDVKDILLQGLKIRAVDYVDALRARAFVVEEYIKSLREIDVLLSPTTKIPAPRISDVVGKEKEFRSVLVSNTELFNLVGAPSITLPLSSINGLPIGLMVSGTPYEDGIVLDVASKIVETVGGNS
ncbi:amidase [Candidatus Acidianus copahuensis]|uniref:Amidase n=1 Tax=Candidatus Acidianus copahuensis TaxID=1160895 RepID=A0A031LHU8_9CREN|nr:amidase [Candidatus Acidianus copahuensis]EZQ01727.1 amidase [Candidatus Acidianus copahuensis]